MCCCQAVAAAWVRPVRAASIKGFDYIKKTLKSLHAPRPQWAHCAPARPPQPAPSEESLRQLLGEQLAAATGQILEQQASLLEELAGQPQVGGCWVLGGAAGALPALGQ